MPVGQCLRRLAGADVRVGTGDILNIELLSELLGESLGNGPRKNVGRSAWRERHDHAHRPGRIIERQRALWASESGSRGSGELKELTARANHDVPPTAYDGDARRDFGASG